jgi:hypothetical protein
MTNQTHKPHWQEIAETQSPHELSQGHLFWLWAYRIGVTGSFAALATFIVERMAGTDATVWNWTAGQYLYGSIGLVFAFAFAVFVYGFYLSEYTIRKRLFVFLVAVSFPLFAEVSQTMYRGEETTMTRSQASPEFQAAQKALDRMTGANPTAVHADGLATATGDKARHQTELAACSRYTSPARRAKCERYEQGKIAEADGRLSGYNTASNAATTAHNADIQSTIMKIGELGNNQRHAHAMVKMLMQVFGWSLLTASLVMAILIIGSIETALSWLGGQVKDYQKAMRSRGLEIGNQKHDVVRFRHDTGNPAPADTQAPAVARFAGAAAYNVGKAGAAIGVEMMKAQAAREQVHAKAADMLGNVGSKLDRQYLPDWMKPEAHANTSDPANVRESSGFKQSPEQRAKVMELAGNTYRQELRNGSKVFSDQPLDCPVSTPSPAETAVPVQSALTGMTMPAQSGQPEPELSDMAKQVEADLYPEWKSMVSRQEITPAAQVAKQFISSRTKDKNAAVGITAPEMGRIWTNWQERAASDGVLTPNPKYQAGNRQPRYITA